MKRLKARDLCLLPPIQPTALGAPIHKSFGLHRHASTSGAARDAPGATPAVVVASAAASVYGRPRPHQCSSQGSEPRKRDEKGLLQGPRLYKNLLESRLHSGGHSVTHRSKGHSPMLRPTHEVQRSDVRLQVRHVDSPPRQIHQKSEAEAEF